MYVGFARHADFGGVVRAHADVSSVATHGDARINGHSLRRNVQIEGIRIAHEIAAPARKMLFTFFNPNHDSGDRQYHHDQKNLAAGDARRSRLYISGASGAFVELD